LREKQKIKRTYCLLEKAVQKNLRDAARMRGVTSDNMLSLLERRLGKCRISYGFCVFQESGETSLFIIST
jgi:small subunit ribosomal protein S4